MGNIIRAKMRTSNFLLTITSSHVVHPLIQRLNHVCFNLVCLAGYCLFVFILGCRYTAGCSQNVRTSSHHIIAHSQKKKKQSKTTRAHLLHKSSMRKRDLILIFGKGSTMSYENEVFKATSSGSIFSQVNDLPEIG